MKAKVAKPKNNIDRKVDHMIANWDKVKCRTCGKTISMLNAKMVRGEYFVCKEH